MNILVLCQLPSGNINVTNAHCHEVVGSKYIIARKFDGSELLWEKYFEDDKRCDVLLNTWE